jgi:hypothetical protein
MTSHSRLPRDTESGALAAVTAFVTALPDELMRLVFDALGDALCIPGEGRDIHTHRLARLINAVREARDILGEVPTLQAYRSLRVNRPELGLPAEGTLRRWAGGTWNDVLALAGLERVTDGDVDVLPLGPQFTAIECVEAVKACTRALGEVPTLQAYLRWARSPEVIALPGRRPRSQGPFQRHFGGWPGVLEALDLSDEALPADVQRRAQRGYRWSDVALFAALHEVHGRLEGRSPTTQEYTRERQRIQEETAAAGAPRLLPAYQVFNHRFGNWDKALEAAGLPPRGGRGVRSLPRGPSTAPGSRYPDDAMLGAIREAWCEIDGDFTAKSYDEWRRARIASARRERRPIERIPSYHVIWKRFGTWDAARREALGTDADGSLR